MEWRERDGVRWLEASCPARGRPSRPGSAGVSEAPFERLNLGDPHRRRARSVRENRRRLAAALGLEPERSRDRPPGPRRRARACTPSAQEPSPFADAVPSPDEVDGHVDRRARPDAAGHRRRLPAGGARRPGRRGDAALRLARARRRDRRRGGRGGRRDRRRDRSGDRALLLRGRGRGARRVRRPRRRRRRRADARPARGRAGACSRAAGVERGRVEPASAPAASPSSSSPTAATAGAPAARPAWSGWRLTMAEPDPRTSTPAQIAANLERVREQRGAGGRDPRRDQVRAAGGDGRAGRGGRRAGRREPPAGPRAPSTSAGATPSSGTSSATCRAAR